MEELNYTEFLEKSVIEYDGPYPRLITNIPHLYLLIKKILDDVDLDFKLRKDLYVVIGYLIHPSDIFPEDSHGPFGFIEDCMLLIFVLKKVIDKHGFEYVDNYWNGTRDLKIILQVYDKLIIEMEDLFFEALKITGFIDESF